MQFDHPVSRQTSGVLAADYLMPTKAKSKARKLAPRRRRGADECTAAPAPKGAISRTVILPREGPDYLGAADFLALLAYPDIKHADQRTRLCRACVDHVIRMWLGKGWITRKELKLVRRLMTNKAIEQTIDKAWRRIRNRRIPAADLFIEVHWFNKRRAVDRVRCTMQNAEIIHRVDDEVASAKKNIITRVRAESQPVLHLAMALNAVIHQGPRRKIGFYTLLNNPIWVRDAINSAEKSRQMYIALSNDPSSCSARLAYRLE